MNIKTDIEGGRRVRYVSSANTVTIDVRDAVVLADITIALPLVASAAGLLFLIRYIDVGGIGVEKNGSDAASIIFKHNTAAGVSSVSLAGAGNYVLLYSTGIYWYALKEG